MSGMKAYMNLKDAGSATELAEPADHPKRALVDLVTMARQRQLPAESAWMLSNKTARKLEQTFGYHPPGGWPAFAGAVTAAGFFDVDAQGFTALIDLVTAEALATSEIRRRCVQGFTQWLAPPAAAAGFFVCLGLHPIWGLRMVQAIDSPFCNQLPMRDESALPSATLELVNQTVFGSLAAVFAALRSLEHDKTYPVAALVPLIVEACRCARQIAGDIDCQKPAIPVFLADLEESEASFRRVADVAVLDMLDTVLVPAGAAKRVGSSGFQIISGALEGVAVGRFSPDEQTSWLGWMTAVEPRFYVA